MKRNEILTIVALVSFLFFIAAWGILSISVIPEKNVEVLSITRDQQVFRKMWQYRVLLPDSTVVVYRSNDIFKVGDKIKI